jgi:transposase
MATKAMTLVGLDVHARQTHAAILDPASGELRVSRLRMPAVEVAAFLEGLGPRTLAVYEAGPTGFSLARAATGRGVDVRVVAPGSIPRGSGDRVKTDRRDCRRPRRGCTAPGSCWPSASRPWKRRRSGTCAAPVGTWSKTAPAPGIGWASSRCATAGPSGAATPGP